MDLLLILSLIHIYYDGIDGDLELDHCDKMPLLAQEMERQGFSTQQIEKIFHGNVLRLYREVLK